MNIPKKARDTYEGLSEEDREDLINSRKVLKSKASKFFVELGEDTDEEEDEDLYGDDDDGIYAKALTRGIRKAKTKFDIEDAGEDIDEALSDAQKVIAEAYGDASDDARAVMAKFVNNVAKGVKSRPTKKTIFGGSPDEEEDDDTMLIPTPNNQANLMDTLIPQKKIDFWIKHRVNVMLIGKHGIGKTHIAKDAAKRSGLRFQYFSCATMDPWVDFIGVPKVRTATVEVKGKKVKKSYLELIRPKAFAFDEVEFLFLDELNRADPKVMNAVLELVQFGSINGKKFKNLKCIWAAINPPASETGDVMYHVQELDPALMSRFQVRVNLPFEPAVDYFTAKYNKAQAKNACSWWMSLNNAQKDAFPPRSMDYALEYVGNGGDVEDVLPSTGAGAIAKSDFIKILDPDFNVQDVVTESYDLIQAVSDPLDGALMRRIRYASARANAAPLLKKVREASMEELLACALNLLEGSSPSREMMAHMMTLVASASRPLRVRLLSNLYTSWCAKVHDDDDEECEALTNLSDEQVRNVGSFFEKKIAEYGAKFKYRKKSKTYDLVKFDHEELRPVEGLEFDGDALLSRQQADLAKKQAALAA